jgi:hypothetical protein
MNVLLINSISGKVLHKFHEKNVLFCQYIGILLDENVAYITYQRIHKQGYPIQEIQVIELYQHKIQDDTAQM